MNKVEKIIKHGLCLGCGLCEAVVGREKCEMIISQDGFYRPVFKTNISKNECEEIVACCPGVYIQGDKQQKLGVWGNILSVAESWSQDVTLRKKSATGGIISSLGNYLLETKKVGAILQVGLKKGDWLHNELLISKTKEDIFANAQSRYAPALVFDRIKIILNQTDDTFAFIGKPCDIAGIKNFIAQNPQYEGRVKCFLAIFCAGIPSYNATKELISRGGEKEDPVFLKYRGNGWPGDFEAQWKNGKSLRVSYNESWGKVLGRTLGLRCKICPDGIGLLADISTGDSWNTKDGYPDFAEADGRNFCFIRTGNGQQVFDEAVKAGYVTKGNMDVSKIKEIHQYQYARRIGVGWRIAAVQIFARDLLNFKDLGIYSLMWKKSLLKGVKEFLGTIKRLK